MKKLGASFYLFVLGLVISVQNTFAAWDVTAIETEIEGAAADIKTIGLAVLTILALLFAYRKIVKTTNKS